MAAIRVISSCIVTVSLMLCCLGMETESAEEIHPREIKAELNPGCGPPFACDNSTTLLHIRATGAKDELHYLWDFTGKPAALLLYFKEPANMTIDWKALWDGVPSIRFTKEPTYYFGIVLQTLYVYNDRREEAHFEEVTDPQDILEYSLQNFDWHRDSLVMDDARAEVSVSAQKLVSNKRQMNNGRHEALVGDLTLAFSTFGMAGHSEKIPHLLHTENATEIDLILKDIRVDRNFSCTRMAIGVTVVSMDEARSNYSLSTRRSVDDEFTPGIFEVINLSSKGGSRGEGFVQYRPVSYTNAEREVATSTLVRQTEPQHPDNQLETLAETIFAVVESVKLQTSLVQNLNISFGVRDDGCFEKTNYTTWTFITAYGQPMPERLSTLVVVLAALGLGLPLVMLISGGCFVCLRKARQS